MRASVRARPALSLADQAAQRTALKPHRIRALLGQIAAENLAFLRAVHLPRPLVGAVRLHAQHDRNADDRPAAVGGIDIVLVGLRLAGLRIVRLPEPDDAAAQGAAAVGDSDARLAALGEPGADRIGRCGFAEAEHGKRNDGGAQDGHGRAPHLVTLWSEPILPSLRRSDNRRRQPGRDRRRPPFRVAYTATAARADTCSRTRLAMPT